MSVAQGFGRCFFCASWRRLCGYWSIAFRDICCHVWFIVKPPSQVFRYARCNTQETLYTRLSERCNAFHAGGWSRMRQRSRRTATLASMDSVRVEALPHKGILSKAQVFCIAILRGSSLNPKPKLLPFFRAGLTSNPVLHAGSRVPIAAQSLLDFLHSLNCGQSTTTC